MEIISYANDQYDKNVPITSTYLDPLPRLSEYKLFPGGAPAGAGTEGPDVGCTAGEALPRVLSVGGGAAFTSSVPSLSVSTHFSISRPHK